MSLDHAALFLYQVFYTPFLWATGMVVLLGLGLAIIQIARKLLGKS